MKKPTSNLGFTLIEVLIAITILAVIMVVVIVTFITSSKVNSTVDASRELQRNIKIAVETIAEDVRKFGIQDVEKTWTSLTEGKFKVWDTIVIKPTYYNTLEVKKYYLWAKNSSGDWIAKTNVQCEETNTECSLLLNDKGSIAPLTNSWVQFESLSFYSSNEIKDKIQINFKIKPSYKKGLSKEFADKATMTFQTSLSERIIDNVTK